MADKRIGELNALTATANTDLTLISDTSASETKKITIENLFQTIPTYVGLAVTPATVTSGVIDITTPISFISVTGTQAYSLAAGSAGQIKMLVCTVAATTPAGVITPVASANDGYNTITFNTIGQTATLLYVNSAWMILSLGGTSASIASGGGPITA
jgi:hypothetical protein